MQKVCKRANYLSRREGFFIGTSESCLVERRQPKCGSQGGEEWAETTHVCCAATGPPAAMLSEMKDQDRLLGKPTVMLTASRLHHTPSGGAWQAGPESLRPEIAGGMPANPYSPWRPRWAMLDCPRFIPEGCQPLAGGCGAFGDATTGIWVKRACRPRRGRSVVWLRPARGHRFANARRPRRCDPAGVVDAIFPARPLSPGFAARPGANGSDPSGVTHAAEMPAARTLRLPQRARFSLAGLRITAPTYGFPSARAAGVGMVGGADWASAGNTCRLTTSAS